MTDLWNDRNERLRGVASSKRWSVGSKAGVDRKDSAAKAVEIAQRGFCSRIRHSRQGIGVEGMTLTEKAAFAALVEYLMLHLPEKQPLSATLRKMSQWMSLTRRSFRTLLAAAVSGVFVLISSPHLTAHCQVP
jgi:hypothetical protein